MRAKQEIFISEAKKLQDYLVVPNNLLLSLGIQTYSHSSFFLIAYAREAGRANPINKGLNRVPFVRQRMPLGLSQQEKYKRTFNPKIN